MPNNIYAGRINGNPLCGLCERVCVEVKTITDGCRSVYENVLTELTLSGFSSTPVYPATFDSLFANGSATLSGLSIEQQTGRSRIRFTATIPATVYLTDANGTVITATTELSFYKDVLLNVPTDSAIPFAVEVAIIARSNVGNFTSPNTISVRMCAVVITRITQKREILIPTYGNCVYPPCREFVQNCGGLTENPVFTDTE